MSFEFGAFSHGDVFHDFRASLPREADLVVPDENLIGPVSMDEFSAAIPQEFSQHLDTLKKATFPVYTAQYVFQGNALAISNQLLISAGQFEIGDAVFIAGRAGVVLLKINTITFLSIRNEEPLDFFVPLAKSRPDSDPDNLYLHVTCQDAIRNDALLSSVAQIGIYGKCDTLAPDGAPVMCPYTGKVFAIHTFDTKHTILHTHDIYASLRDISQKEDFYRNQAAQILAVLENNLASQLQELFLAQPQALAPQYAPEQTRQDLFQFLHQRDLAFQHLAEQQYAAYDQQASQPRISYVRIADHQIDPSLQPIVRIADRQIDSSWEPVTLIHRIPPHIL